MKNPARKTFEPMLSPYVDGELTAEERVRSVGAPALYLAARAARALGLGQQPGLLRTEHRQNGRDGAKAHEVFRLQGGASAGLGRVLVEDVADSLRRFVANRRPQRGRQDLSPVTTKPQPMQRSLPLIPAVNPLGSCATECESVPAAAE